MTLGKTEGATMKHYSGVNRCQGITLEMNHVKEGNVLFNDALNTFYVPLYGVGRHT